MRRAVFSGVLCSLGFLVVFSAIGASASLIGNLLSSSIPFLELAVGLIIILMGLLTIFNVNFPFIPAPRIFPGASGRGSFYGIFLYGLLYGLGAIGCSAPIFFAVLFYAMSSGGLYHSLIIFIFYAIGMSLPIVLITILVAKANELILRKIAQASGTLKKLSGVTLVIVGLYLAVIAYLTF